MVKKTLRTKLVLGLILVLTFLLRIINLNYLPIFTDEAIYIRWTQIANQDPNWRFISLTDGKQPLFIWLNMISQRLFTEPLFAGRLVSVIAGVFTSLGLFFMGSLLFNKRVGFWSSLLWAIFPLALWHDRLALMDSLLAAFTIWALWLEVLLIKSLRVDVALFLGMTIGGGLLTKSSAQFLCYLLPFSLLLAKFKKANKFFLKWFGLALLSLALALLINAIQRLSPFYYLVGLKNLTFIYSFNEIFSLSFLSQWQRFWGNLKGLSGWLMTYLTPSFLFLILFSLFDFKRYFRIKTYLLFCFLLPFLTLAFFGKVLYPRFFLFMTLPLIILMASALEKIRLIKNSFLIFILYLLFFSYPAYFTSQIIFNPVNAPLPKVDRGQYLDDWPAGWGINEVVDYLKKESVKEKIAVATEGTFGLTPAALEIYLHNNPNVEIKGFWPITDGFEWLKEKAKKQKTFVIFKDTQRPDSTWPLQLIAKYKRGKSDNHLSLYYLKINE